MRGLVKWSYAWVVVRKEQRKPGLAWGFREDCHMLKDRFEPSNAGDILHPRRTVLLLLSSP